MDWVHCNSCFSQPNENYDATEQKFYLTSCGHIFCEHCGCFVNGTPDCCNHCKSKCSSTVIGEKSFQTNPQVFEYFKKPEEICAKLLKILQFQKSHRIKLLAHHQYTSLKYNRAKKYIHKLENELSIAKNTLRNTSRNCATETQSISTPIFQRNSTPFKMMDNASQIRSTPKAKLQKYFDLQSQRKQSFRNELSILFSRSTASGISTPGSSKYDSPLQRNYDDKSIPKIDSLHLNSFT